MTPVAEIQLLERAIFGAIRSLIALPQARTGHGIGRRATRRSTSRRTQTADASRRSAYRADESVKRGADASLLSARRPSEPRSLRRQSTTLIVSQPAASDATKLLFEQ